jgi:kumamolisin
MKVRFVSLVSVVIVLCWGAQLLGQDRVELQDRLEHNVKIHMPESSIERDEDFGFRAHTNHVIAVVPQEELAKAARQALPAGESPASLRAVYNLPPTGGANVIAIVDAYDYPTAENDLNVFSNMYGLPPCTTSNGCFQRVYASGSKPRANCGWAQEAALDIEWAHAMAPNARIVFVEAASASFNDLFRAVDVASSLVSPKGTGLGEVSMSWGGSEFSSEANYDYHFTTKGVVYFAASGDTGGVTIYPGVSPDVVSAGGTSVHRDSNGNFVSETGWSGSGGGPSRYEPRPSYQSGIASIVGSKRGAPDFSFDADPASGVAVYDSTSCQGMVGWMVFGGTSVAAPSLSGLVNLVGHFHSSSIEELTTMYTDPMQSTDFRDIISGTAGRFSAKLGWDFVTGIGSNLGLQGK